MRSDTDYLCARTQTIKRGLSTSTQLKPGNDAIVYSLARPRVHCVHFTCAQGHVHVHSIVHSGSPSERVRHVDVAVNLRPKLKQLRDFTCLAIRSSLPFVPGYGCLTCVGYGHYSALKRPSRYTAWSAKRSVTEVPMHSASSPYQPSPTRAWAFIAWKL